VIARNGTLIMIADDDDGGSYKVMSQIGTRLSKPTTLRIRTLNCNARYCRVRQTP